MNARHTLFLVAASAAMFSVAAHAQTSDTRAAAMQFSVTGTVTSIDRSDRVVAVQGPEGRTSVFAVGPDVRNFDAISVGDRVDVDYDAAVAITLAKGTIGREKVETEVAARAPAGGKPGVAAARATTIVARIENVDRERSLATLQGPEGRYVVVQVRDPQVLADLKPGEDVIVGFFEAAAVSVRPAK